MMVMFGQIPGVDQDIVYVHDDKLVEELTEHLVHKPLEDGRGIEKVIRHDPIFIVEVCTGSKLKPEPGPCPRLSDPTRPDPSGTVKFRARTRPKIPPPPHTHNE